MTWGRTAAPTALAAALSLAAVGCSGTKDYVVPVESMEPGITRGETVEATVVDDYEPERGDIVVLEDPGGWLVGCESDPVPPD
jgi:signal peptidase I